MRIELYFATRVEVLIPQDTVTGNVASCSHCLHRHGRLSLEGLGFPHAGMYGISHAYRLGRQYDLEGPCAATCGLLIYVFK
jgi:hypothetical protein